MQNYRERTVECLLSDEACTGDSIKEQFYPDRSRNILGCPAQKGSVIFQVFKLGVNSCCASSLPTLRL